MVDNNFVKAEVLLENLDETKITSLITKWKEVNDVKKEIEEINDMLRTKIKIYLKERNWERYVDDDTKTSITISKIRSETIDKKQLKLMLTDVQLAQVMRVTTYEKLSIITPEIRKRLKRYVKK